MILLFYFTYFMHVYYIIKRISTDAAYSTFFVSFKNKKNIKKFVL